MGWGHREEGTGKGMGDAGTGQSARGPVPASSSFVQELCVGIGQDKNGTEGNGWDRADRNGQEQDGTRPGTMKAVPSLREHPQDTAPVYPQLCGAVGCEGLGEVGDNMGTLRWGHGPSVGHSTCPLPCATEHPMGWGHDGAQGRGQGTE